MDTVTARRLAFIKYLWQRGGEMTREPAPMSAAALLALHDAVELFLQLASEHLDAGSRQPSFMDYWDLLAPKMQEPLGQKEAMRRLNKARVALKHHGTFPSDLDLDAFRASAEDFFTENTERVFGVPLHEVSLVAFVTPDETRAHLESAIAHLALNEVDEALASAGLAFTELRAHADGRAADRWGMTPFQPDRDLRGFSSFSRFRAIDDPDGEFHRFCETVARGMTEIYDALALMALGVDYHRYLRFKQATPLIQTTMDGNHHLTWLQTAASPKRSAELAQFAINFVVESSLALAKSEPVHGLFRRHFQVE